MVSTAKALAASSDPSCGRNVRQNTHRYRHTWPTLTSPSVRLRYPQWGRHTWPITPDRNKQDFDSCTHCGAQVGTLSLYRCHVVTCSSDFLYVAIVQLIQEVVPVVRVGYRCAMCMRCASGSGWPHTSPTAWGHGVVTLICSTRSSTHTYASPRQNAEIALRPQNCDHLRGGT